VHKLENLHVSFLRQCNEIIILRICMVQCKVRAMMVTMSIFMSVIDKYGKR
jgi:hypothetical protein